MTQRSCGGCTLCCTLTPVEEIGKLANTRCRFQTDVCCSIYSQRPMSCRLWSCRWLTGDDTADLPRPDAAGYVIDILADIIKFQIEDDEEVTVEAVQVWCDPAKRDAWRTPELRDYIVRRAAEGIVTLVRFGSREGLVVFAGQNGEWREEASGVCADLSETRRELLGY